MKKKDSIFKFATGSFLMCLMLLLTGAATHAQQTYTFSGTVTDASVNQPIIGATIIIGGTSIGTTTDFDGNYNISASLQPGNYRLVFSYLGFSSQTINVTLGNDTNIQTNVSLSPDLMNLDEVIVTGTSVGTSRRQLGNAISTISAKAFEDGGATAIDQGLSGKIAGALVQQNSGDPAGGISVRLRGPSTIAGSSDPLYVIDGLIVSNSSTELVDLGGNTQNRLVDINPSDIDRIEIIKGAAAAAIYGSRASNGVVQIFTKRGKSGKPSFSFTSNFKINELRDEMEYNKVPLAWVDPFDRNNLATVPTERFNLQDEIFDTGVGTENYLSVSGGNENTKYYVSGSFLHNEGIVKNTNFQRFSFNSNIDQKLYSWLNLSMGLTYTQSESEDIPNGGINAADGAITGFLFSDNSINPAPDASGVFPVTSLLVPRTNPAEAVERFEFQQRTNRTITNIGLIATPFDGFTANFRAGFDYFNQSATGFIPPGNTSTQQNGFATRSDANNFQYNTDLNLSYKFDITEDIESTTVLGGTWQFERFDRIGLTSDRLPPGVKVASGGTIIGQIDSRSKKSFWGGFLQQTFGYKDKLYITGAIRLDGASVFGEDEREQFYGKASGSYVVSAEDFWSETFGNVINSFKVRASWGQAGNLTAIGAFDRFFNFNPLSIGGSSAVIPSSLLGNEGLKPERQEEYEFGVDAGFWQNRIGIEFTYYKQNVDDLLLQRELAPSTGFATRFENVGELENEGIEILLRANPIKTKDFNWNLTTTYSRNNNTVTKVAGNNITLPGSFSTSFVIEGQPLGVFFRSFYARDANGDIALDANGFPVRGTNPDGSTSKVIGDPNPDWFGSLINEFTYKNFAFKVQLDAVQGFDVFNWNRRLLDNVIFGGGAGVGEELLGNKLKGTGSVQANIFEEFVEDGSFVKLREISLSYTFRPEKLGLQSLKLSLVGRNLISWDDYSGLDPEINTTGQSNGVRGFDFAAVPIPRTFQIGVNATF
jgi:TonB-linked SusC/RagA family outer membrane protein